MLAGRKTVLHQVIHVKGTLAIVNIHCCQFFIMCSFSALAMVTLQNDILQNLVLCFLPFLIVYFISQQSNNVDRTRFHIWREVSLCKMCNKYYIRSF